MKKRVVITDGKHADFIMLVHLLDEYLQTMNKELMGLFTPYNTLEEIYDVVLLYDGTLPVACGGFKRYAADTVEIKRIFVREEYRKQGLAREVVHNLEHIARYKGYSYAIVETGVSMEPARGLYQNLGYQVILNYPPYVGNDHSVCMKKELG